MSYLSTILADGPKGYWKFDDTSGTTALDSSGGARHGTYTVRVAPGFTLGQTSLLAADSGNSVLFGTGGVNVPDNSVWQITGDLSMVLWIKMTDQTATYFLITKCVSNGGTQNAYEWRLSGSPAQPAFLQGNGVSVLGTNSLSNNTTYMLGVTRTGGAGGTIKHYLNGQPNGSGTLSATPDACSGHDVMIGGREDTGFNNVGYLDEPAIFNKVLSDADMLAIYNAGISYVPADPGFPTGPVILGTSPADVYVVPTTALAQARELRIVNTLSKAVTVNVSFGVDAVSKRWLSGYQIAPGDVYEWAGLHLIPGGTRVQASCSDANACEIYLNGILQT